jgi:acyl-CoA thioesterase
MDQQVRAAIFKAFREEPYAQALRMELVELDDGYSVVEMVYDQTQMNNIFQRAHGGAIFGLIDGAFETANQTSGTIGVALNVSVTYIASPEPSAKLKAEAKQISETKKTASFDIKVTDQNNKLIATCQALGYRTGKPLPFV